MNSERDSLPVELPHFYVPADFRGPPGPPATTRKKGLGLSDIPRLAGYAIALFLGWLLFSTLVKPWISSSATRAIIDAPAILITAPIDGSVTALHTQPGDRIKPGQPIADVSNKTVTRDTLTSLLTRQLNLKSQQDDLNNRIQTDSRTLDFVNKQYQSYHHAAMAQLSGARDSVAAEQDAAEAEARAASTAYWRAVGMHRDGAVSAAEVSAKRAALDAAQSKADAAQQSARTTGASLAAAASGVYLSGNGSDGVLPKLAERRNDLTNNIQSEKLQSASLGRQLADLDALIARENQRVDSLSSYTVRADAPGVAQEVIAPVGAQVKAGSTIVRATDCAKSGIVAVFSSHLAPRLTAGTEIKVSANGLYSPLRAHIVQLMPSASNAIQDGYSVAFPYAEDGSVYALAHWDDNTPPDLRREACSPGRSVEASLL